LREEQPQSQVEAAMPKTSSLAWGAVCVASVGLAGMYWAGRQGTDPFSHCRTSVISGGSGAIGGDFTLVDEDGQTVRSTDLFQKPALVYFGYTYCPDICPTDNARNSEATDILEKMGHLITPVFISVDPGRDTPDVLKDWTDFMHPRMIGLTGTPEQIRIAAEAFKTYYRIPDAAPGEPYEVDHMTNTYLMLPTTGFAEFFSRDLTAQQVADRAACFLSASTAT
jgi:protein SCO1